MLIMYTTICDMCHMFVGHEQHVCTSMYVVKEQPARHLYSYPQKVIAWHNEK